MVSNVLCALLLLVACNTNSNRSSAQKAEVAGTDSLKILADQWNSDLAGCDSLRSIDVFKRLLKGYALDRQKEGEILNILGKPNAEESYADEKVIIYYFDSMCRNNQLVEGSDKSSIRIIFDLQGKYLSYDTRIE